MWSPDRRGVLGLLAGLPLAACGYSPVYAPGSTASALRGRVEAEAPTTRDAFAFVARIEERLGRPETPAYRLTYSIRTRRLDLAVTTAGSILRYNLVGSLDWVLTDAATGETIARGRAESFTGAAANEPTIAAQAAEEAARTRLMSILADQTVTQMLAQVARASTTG